MSKYKIGDKVRIKSIEWYNQNKDSFGLVLSDNDTNVFFCYNMQKHCGEELTVRHISENGRYVLTDMNEGSGTRELYMWSWSEWMFEERK
jgi:hypothetical protein